MAEKQKYMIEIYHNGVVMQAHIRGIDRYRQEKAFLAGLIGQPHSSTLPDFYLLNEDQLKAYGAFRRKLNED